MLEGRENGGKEREKREERENIERRDGDPLSPLIDQWSLGPIEFNGTTYQARERKRERKAKPKPLKEEKNEGKMG